MADYNKLTVANLRAVLKERNIPSTGLTRKQQIIDRLEQADREVAAQSDVQNAPVPEEEAVDTQPTLESEATEKAAEEAAEEATEPPAEAPPAEAAQDNAESRHAQSELPAPLESQSTIQPAGETPTPVTSESSATIAAEETQQTAPSSSTQQSTTQIPIPTSESHPQAPPAAPPPQSQDAPPLSGVSSIDSLKASELEEDRRKRKRRSMSPPVIESEVVNKKLRQEEDAGTLHLKEDAQQGDVGMEKDAKSQAEQPKEKRAEAELKEAAEDAKMTEQDSAQVPMTADDQHEPAPKGPSTKGPERDGRYNDLFQGAAASSLRSLQESSEVDERSVEPSIHPATTALYIRNFMRPLHPGQLRSHLISLATAPSSPPDDSILQTFYLDQIRTHAYARFTSSSPAARVRSALHGRKWPAERDRKELWVDFVPEEKVEEWIEVEQESGGGRNKRWEVVYDSTPNGGVEAILREAGSDSMIAPSRPHETDQVPPNGSSLRGAGSRRPTEAERLAPSAPEQPEGAGKSFVALDKLFQSTTTKPKLYFQPVSADIANKRLDELDHLSSRDWRGGRGLDGGEELRRYTFEDRSVLVDGGLHYTGPRVRGRERDVGGYRSPPRGSGGGYGRKGGYRAR